MRASFMYYQWCFIVILLSSTIMSTNSFANVALDKRFIADFRHELSNRAFARLATDKMRRIARSSEERSFWSAYHQLELLNEKIYGKKAKVWQLDSSVNTWTKVKAGLIGLMPGFSHGWLLKSTLKRTEAYVDFLRSMNDRGPKEEADFLHYILAQEILQVSIMRKAASGDFSSAADEAEQFIRQYEDLANQG